MRKTFLYYPQYSLKWYSKFINFVTGKLFLKSQRVSKRDNKLLKLSYLLIKFLEIQNFRPK